MSKPLKEDYIIRIKSRIEQRLDEPAAEEEKEEFVELMTRGSFVLKGGSYYVTYRETETTGYEGCTTTLKIAADGSRVAMLRFGKGGGAGTQLLIEKGRRNLCHYETGFGSMTLGVTADEIDCQLTEKGGTARFADLLDAVLIDLQRVVTTTMKPDGRIGTKRRIITRETVLQPLHAVDRPIPSRRFTARPRQTEGNRHQGDDDHHDHKQFDKCECLFHSSADYIINKV